MKTENIISVIVPVFNVEKYLEQCVNSIINQSYSNLEILLIDDGSTDKSGEMCDELSKKDSRIKVIHKENGGLSDARNVGIEASNGEYIAFVDSDDMIEPSMFEVMLEMIEAKSVDIVLCNAKRMWEKEIGDSLWEVEEKIITGQEALNRLGKKNRAFYVIACNKLYKRNIFNELRFPKGYYHEDEAMIHYIFDRCKKVYLLPDALYFYRQRDDSIMGSGISTKRVDTLVALSDRIQFFENRNEKENVDCAIKEFDDYLWLLVTKVSNLQNEEKYYSRFKSSIKKIWRPMINSSEVIISHKVYFILMLINYSFFRKIYSLRNNGK